MITQLKSQFIKSLAILVLVLAMLFPASDPVIARKALTQQDVSSEQAVRGALSLALLKADSSGGHGFQAAGDGYISATQGMSVQMNRGTLKINPTQSAAWSWSIKLTGFGRQGSMQRAALQRTDARLSGLDNQYDGLTEWYRLTGIGLEQGFTLPARPGLPDSGALILQLNLQSTLTGSLSPDSRSLTFDAGDGSALFYNNLRAFDANGMDLPAQLTYDQGQIGIQVDDSAAVYPITIDPLVFIQTKVLAADLAPSDHFGTSVAISGNTAVISSPGKTVGANESQGAAYVFVQNDGIWTQVARLTASNGGIGDQFGDRVSISGDTIVVSAHTHIDVHGSAYVFVKPGSGWEDMTETAELTASDSTSSDLFGSSVAISGDTVAVGASSKNNFHGAVYIYTKPAGGWASTSAYNALLTAADGAQYDYFGSSIAISSNLVVISANGRQEVYLFGKPVGGWASTSIPSAVLGASDKVVGNSDNFGCSVAMDGNTIVVGASGVSIGHKGAVYVFVKPDSGWTNIALTTETAKLSSADAAEWEQLGASVSISGNTVAAGAPGTSTTLQGAVYVFVKPETTWATTSSFTDKITISDAAASDQFGFSTAITGKTVSDAAIISGAPNKPADNYSGSAYFFTPFRTNDLAIKATANNLTPAVGTTIHLVSSVSNLGSDVAKWVVVSSPLPAGLHYTGVTFNHPGSTYDPFTGEWSIYSLPTHVTMTMDLQVSIEAIAAGQTLIFSPTLTGWDANAANNTATVTLNIPFIITGNTGTPATTLSYSVGGKAQTATSNGSGNYRISVPSAWSGTITPSKTGFAFTPVNRTYTNVSANQPDQNYTATQVVRISGNTWVAAATLSYTDGTAKTVRSDSSGNYVITLPTGWSGKVTVSKTGSTFQPSSRDYSNITKDQIHQDFTAVFSIAGSTGTGGASANLNYAGTFSWSGTAAANSSGIYSFTVPSGWTGTVTPAKVGVTFTPVSRSYTNVLANQTSQNYTSAPTVYTITGNVSVPAATLSYMDGTLKTVTSGSDGRYSIPVRFGWSGTVTPSKSGITFIPANIAYTSVKANQTGKNYSATMTFLSNGAQDGWLLESNPGSGLGGSMNATATTFLIGDNITNSQYLSILSFNTSTLPASAIIQSAYLKINTNGTTTGKNPFSALGSLVADISSSYFGSSAALELADFNAVPSAYTAAAFNSVPTAAKKKLVAPTRTGVLSGMTDSVQDGQPLASPNAATWYTGTLDSGSYGLVSKTAQTQFRLYFSLPTDKSGTADNMTFFSGNASSGQPQFIVTFTMP